MGFSSDPNWATGTSVRVASDGGGLSANTNYFVRNLGDGQYSFFTSSAAASSNTGPISLTGPTGVLSLAPVVSATDTTNDAVTFTADPQWTTGTPIQLTSTVGGLEANTNYFVRSLGGGKYNVFTSAAASTRP